MSFAVIKTGGKQYKVAPGETLIIEKLARTSKTGGIEQPASPAGGPAKGEAVIFSEVLLVDDGRTTKIGKEVASTKVTATIVGEGKGKKIDVIRFKAKSNRKRKIGHRQPFTKIKIEEIK